MQGKLTNLSTWLSQISETVEVILIYDESSDNTHLELSEIVSANIKGSQITLLSGKFGNPGFARNAGLVVAKADWICFWDSDDLGFPTTITDVLAAREQNELAQVYCFGYEQVSPNGSLQNWDAWEDSANSNLRSISLNPGLWRFCFSRKLALSQEFTKLKMGEDQLYLAQIGIGNLSVRFENGVAYRYFRNVVGQLTSNYDALVELGDSIDALLMERRKSINNIQFIVRLLTRQLLTVLRVPNIKLQVRGISLIFSLLLRNPKLVFEQIYLIVRNRKIE